MKLLKPLITYLIWTALALLLGITYSVLSSCKPMVSKNNNNINLNELVMLCEKGDESCDGVSITYFKKNHLINKNGQLAKKENVYDTISETFKYTGKHTPIPLMTLVNYHTKTDIDNEEVVIKNGYATQMYKASVYKRNAIYQPDSVKLITYKKGNLSGDFKIINTKSRVLYQTKFKNGNGNWKDYYYKAGKLKEEGKVKNNYKVGEWKYYSISGTIDSVKTYTIQDSVDVRFPYNLFNKKEPVL